MSTDPRRGLPQVEQLVRTFEHAFPQLPRPVVADAVRTVVSALRRRARRTGAVPALEEVEAAVRDELSRRDRRRLVPVLNATGVVVHTNLGRAPLAPEAVEAVARAAAGYTNLEFDLTTGRRGDRFGAVESMLAVAVGAEAALVVNNNAAAVLLACKALAEGREIVVSRGELVEIGGEFRIPEVLAQSGAVLREVGTTNRTHLRDYESAIGDGTALILKVHPSNYRIVGFTASPPVSELVALARRRKVPLLYDAGSGLVGRTLGDEPEVSALLGEGVDLVCFSGDKLFGGPQAGVVCGSRPLVDRMRTHPLMRALRPDKMTLAALGHTTAMHLQGRTSELPVWQMIEADEQALEARSAAVAGAARAAGYTAEVVRTESATGGGSLPGFGLPSPAVALKHPAIRAAQLMSALRTADPVVIARVDGGRVLLDLRTVPAEADASLTDALRQATG